MIGKGIGIGGKILNNPITAVAIEVGTGLYNVATDPNGAIISRAAITSDIYGSNPQHNITLPNGNTVNLNDSPYEYFQVNPNTGEFIPSSAEKMYNQQLPTVGSLVSTGLDIYDPTRVTDRQVYESAYTYAATQYGVDYNQLSMQDQLTILQEVQQNQLNRDAFYQNPNVIPYGNTTIQPSGVVGPQTNQIVTNNTVGGIPDYSQFVIPDTYINTLKNNVADAARYSGLANYYGGLNSANSANAARYTELAKKYFKAPPSAPINAPTGHEINNPNLTQGQNAEANRYTELAKAYGKKPNKPTQPPDNNNNGGGGGNNNNDNNNNSYNPNNTGHSINNPNLTRGQNAEANRMTELAKSYGKSPTQTKNENGLTQGQQAESDRYTAMAAAHNNNSNNNNHHHNDDDDDDHGGGGGNNNNSGGGGGNNNAGGGNSSSSSTSSSSSSSGSSSSSNSNSRGLGRTGDGDYHRGR